MEADKNSTVDVARLRRILRGLRSRKEAVRRWALEEANRLGESEKTLLDAMVDRSFREEAGRRRFWRFSAFFGSSVATDFVIHSLRFVPVIRYVGDLLSLFLWLYLWHSTDRYAKREFVLPQDGRTLWQKRRKEALKASGDAIRMSEAGNSALPISSERGVATPSPLVEAFVSRLTAGEATREDAAPLSDAELLAVARQLSTQYEQSLKPENRKRARISSVAFWLFVVGVFTNDYIPWFPVALAVGLCALYYRDRRSTRILENLATVLDVLQTERGVSILLDNLFPHTDPTFINRMKRRCPALERLVPDTALPTEQVHSLSAEECDALRELSAEVLLSPFENVEDTLAALKRLETIGNETVLQTVQRLAAPAFWFTLRTPPKSLSDYRHDSARIRQAARSCLEALSARLDVQERILVRASHGPQNSSGLLRPVQAGVSEEAPDRLLRPAEAPSTPTLPTVRIEPPRYGVAEESVQQASGGV